MNTSDQDPFMARVPHVTKGDMTVRRGFCVPDPGEKLTKSQKAWLAAPVEEMSQQIDSSPVAVDKPLGGLALSQTQLPPHVHVSHIG